MSKVTISRLLETSRYLQTQAGQQLSDFISYVADLVENSVRILSKGVGIDDNLDTKRMTVSLKHATDTVINVGTKQPIWIVPARIFSTSVRIDSFLWFTNQAGETVVNIGLVGAPTTAFDISLVIFYS